MANHSSEENEIDGATTPAQEQPQEVDVAPAVDEVQCLSDTSTADVEVSHPPAPTAASETDLHVELESAANDSQLEPEPEPEPESESEPEPTEHERAVFAIEEELKKKNVGAPTWDAIEQMLLDDESALKSLKQDMKDVSALFHERVGVLIDDFILVKQQHGTSIEKEIYKNMTQDQLIDRLIQKRPLMFMGGGDSYILPDGDNGYGGFEQIGTTSETAPLTLDKFMSYDEIAISALMSVGGPTTFINKGDRYNQGRYAGIASDHIRRGVYVGCVGARFERLEQMEWRHMIISKEQNVEEKGYGANGTGASAHLLKAWAKMYGLQHFPLYADVEKALQSGDVDETSYAPVPYSHDFFDRNVFRARMRLTIAPFLAYANKVAAARGTTAYVHVVGLGLGVWMKHPSQGQDMVQVYSEIITSNTFDAISDIDFSWFPHDCTSCGGVQNGGSLNNITIHFSRRNPADPLTPSDKNKLLVAQYAWDGNAFPGNEYWAGMLSASGDPAAAACSTIPVVHNSIFNSENLNGAHAKKIFSDNWTPKQIDLKPYVAPVAPPLMIGENHTTKLDDVENWEVRAQHLQIMREQAPEHFAGRQKVATMQTVFNVISDVAETSDVSSEHSGPKIARKRSLDDVNVYSKSIGVIQKPAREYSFLPELNRSVKLWRGDIDLIEVQHVILPSSGEVARRLRERAGAQQLAKARESAYKADGVFTTDAGDLPADSVVHISTLKSLEKLRGTMKELLRLCSSDDTRSIAIPCLWITPRNDDLLVDTLRITVQEVREWLVSLWHSRTGTGELPQVVFAVKESRHEEIFEQLLSMYFPTQMNSDDIHDTSENGMDVDKWLSGSADTPNVTPKAKNEEISPASKRSRLGQVSYKNHRADIIGDPNRVVSLDDGENQEYSSVDLWMEAIDHSETELE